MEITFTGVGTQELAPSANGMTRTTATGIGSRTGSKDDPDQTEDDDDDEEEDYDDEHFGESLLDDDQHTDVMTVDDDTITMEEEEAEEAEVRLLLDGEAAVEVEEHDPLVLTFGHTDLLTKLGGRSVLVRALVSVILMCIPFMLQELIPAVRMSLGSLFLGAALWSVLFVGVYGLVSALEIVWRRRHLPQAISFDQERDEITVHYLVRKDVHSFPSLHDLPYCTARAQPDGSWLVIAVFALKGTVIRAAVFESPDSPDFWPPGQLQQQPKILRLRQVLARAWRAASIEQIIINFRANPDVAQPAMT